MFTSLWDPIRKQWVAKTPEEEIRQELLRKMIGELGYPRGLISVEKGLKSKRRYDILCFAKGEEGLRPLLLVECKSGELKRGAEEQAFGYNSSIGAPFLCLASQMQMKTIWREKGGFASVPFLPTFSQLMEKACLFLKM